MTVYCRAVSSDISSVWFELVELSWFRSRELREFATSNSQDLDEYLYKQELKSSLYGSLVLLVMAVDVEGGDTVIVVAED